jgi:hypothetical protein
MKEYDLIYICILINLTIFISTQNPLLKYNLLMRLTIVESTTGNERNFSGGSEDMSIGYFI